MQKMGRIGLGRSNEKIEWKREDEIGSLIAEYNRMVDELERSADLLARSERESAWREMAKQVAHEIKNPLTPMKLSVQYLKKAWDEDMPDFNERLNRISKTLIEQIDSLSAIATEFSDFAKMPSSKRVKVDLKDSIKSAIDLFKDIENVLFSTHFLEEQDYIVLADKKQMMRVFTNLIKNSVQAIGKDSEGRIQIRISVAGDLFRIEVADNGAGMSEEIASKIFSPSFTTKSSGMGLGLTMVKSIINDAGGEISFQSEEGTGASFIILIPKYS
jgi:nitrogen fixation/metabolism regulation signal transduction histidine kinase